MGLLCTRSTHSQGFPLKISSIDESIKERKKKKQKKKKEREKKLSSSRRLDAVLPVGCEEQEGTGSDAH